MAKSEYLKTAAKTKIKKRRKNVKDSPEDEANLDMLIKHGEMKP